MRSCSIHNSRQTELIFTVLRCRESGDAPLKNTLKQARKAPDQHKGRRLYCAACKHLITSHEHRMEVQGAHAHTCTNPQEITFHIGCFRQAAGCIAIGAATEAHTWFAGSAWQVALCASCGNHLGWWFCRNGADGFFGLILAELVSEH